AAHQVLFLERGEELVEVELLRQVALALQVAHPVHRLLDIAAGGQDQLVEQPQQVEAGEDPADQLRVEVEVLVAHQGRGPRSVDVAAVAPSPATAGAAAAARLEQLELHHL